MTGRRGLNLRSITLDKQKKTSFDVFFVYRGDGTRTHGLCVPNAALYQTEPHLVVTKHILSKVGRNVKGYLIAGGHINRIKT